jgi:protease-4
MSLAQYRWGFGGPIWRPVLPARYVAVITVHGTIGLDASSSAGGANVAALTAALNRVRRDRRALAAVLHVNSPGGSALASDHIHREVSRLALRKPVVACFGEVAASGGYYVAAPAQRIVAQPTTVTGSIGVIYAKIVVEKLLERAGVRPQGLKTAAHADMFSVTRRLDHAEHAIMEREAQGVYRTFLGVVAAGRKRPVDEIEALAAGRVWTGRDALRNGLVDRLGGLDVALDEARALVPDLSREAQRRLQPKFVRSFASTRGLPTAAEPEALFGAWLRRVSPELVGLWSAQASGERLLLLAPWLDSRF